MPAALRALAAERLSRGVTMEVDWADGHYEALECLYWEPQHLGGKKHALSRYDRADKVSRHVQGAQPMRAPC